MLYLAILGGVSCCCEGSSPSHPDPPFLLDSSQPVLDISTKLQLYHRHCCQFHGFGPGARAGHRYLFIRASTSIQLPFLTLAIQTLLGPGIEPENINQGLTLLHYLSTPLKNSNSGNLLCKEKNQSYQVIPKQTQEMYKGKPSFRNYHC